MNKINSLRSALEFLKTQPGQLVETDIPVDPEAELSGVYRRVGAGGTVMRPTHLNGPAMVFRNIEGFPDTSIAIGLMASRERVAAMFGCRREELGHLVKDCAEHPIQPVVTDEPAPVQEIVHRADEPGFDLHRLVPAPKNTPVDAGPYITLGMCYATHPDTGLSDVTIHRMCIQSRDELSIFLQPGSRHIGAMAERATELGQPLPISVSIGVDPAISVTSCFEPPTTPLGFNELSIAGALRKEPVKLAKCVTINEHCIANAEYVIEGEILPGKVLNVYSHRAGGGKYMAVLQCKKTVHTDEGKQRQAALLAFSAFSELKHVILVDEDVDIFDTDDVLWAMNTRFQGDRDIITIPGVRCHPLDPSSSPLYSGSIRDVGISCKTIFDCTVPFDQKDRFKRAHFLDIDETKWRDFL
ncbi:MAG: UbiD family decarboxylase [Eubacteriales bacterium]|jgi:3-polyprenyl-4-hydroxybenzoate decarboxylase